MEETLTIVSPDGNKTAIIKINDTGEILIASGGLDYYICLVEKS